MEVPASTQVYGFPGWSTGAWVSAIVVWRVKQRPVQIRNSGVDMPPSLPQATVSVGGELDTTSDEFRMFNFKVRGWKRWREGETVGGKLAKTGQPQPRLAAPRAPPCHPPHRVPPACMDVRVL